MKYLDEKYKRKQLPRGNSEKVHAKSIEASVNDAVSIKNDETQYLRKIHPLSLESEAKVHTKSIEASVIDAVSKRIYDIGTRANSPKVHAKSIESSVNDAVSKEKLASGDAGLGKGKRKT